MTTETREQRGLIIAATSKLTKKGGVWLVKINEVSADLAYSTYDNLLNVALQGGKPMIPFKCNASPGQGGLWAKMLGYFRLHRDEFLSRYHKRPTSRVRFRW